MLEPGIWIVCLLLVGAGLALLAARASRSLLTPLSLYVAIWVSVILAFVMLPVGFPALEAETWGIVAIASAAFAVGCIAAYETRSPLAPAPTRLSYDEGTLLTLYKVGVALLAVYTAVQIWLVLPLLSSVGGLSAIVGGEGLEFRQLLIEDAAQRAGSGQDDLALGALSYFLFIGAITLFWAGWYARLGEWRWALPPLVLMAGYSLLTLQRFTFVYSLGLFLFSYAFHRDVAGDRARGRFGLGVLAAIAVAVLIVPLALRYPELTGTERLRSLFDYFLSGLAGLNEVYAQGLSYPEPYPGYGMWTFHGVAQLLSQFGGGFELPRPNFEFVTVNTGAEEPLYTNVYGWIVYPLYDFGMFGLISFGLVAGFAATRLHDAVTRRGRLDLIPAASIAMTSVLMSFFSLSLLRDARWLFLIAVSLALRRLVLKPAGQSEAGLARPGGRPLRPQLRSG